MGRFICQLCKSCFCCGFCPKLPCVQSSTCANALYFSVFMLGTVLIWLAYTSQIPTKKLPFCYNDLSIVCVKYSEYLAVYRIAFTFALFFVIMCVSTIGVSSSRNIRFVIHNGFWFFKLVFLGLLTYSTFHIPYGWFDITLMHVSLCFLVSFSIFELILYTGLINDAGKCCLILFWREASSSTKILLFCLMLPLFATGLILGAFLYVYYSSCKINLAFITVNLILSYLINFISIIIKFFKKEMYAVLKGSVLTTHVMFLTWSAITNNPEKGCNPSEADAIFIFKISNFINILSIYFGVSFGVEYFFREPQKDQSAAVIYVEERGREICGFWGKRKVVEIIQPPVSDMLPQCIIYKTTDKNDDEYDQLKYKWYAIHEVFMHGTFYIMICFTDNYFLNWNTKGDNLVFHNYTAMWFKIVSSWICIIIFFFTDIFTKSRMGGIFFLN